MRTELEFLETQKRQLAKQRGSQASLKQLLGKQAALVRRWKEEAAELDKLLLAQRLADDRRKLMLEQDARLRRDSEVRELFQPYLILCVQANVILPVIIGILNFDCQG